MKKRIGAVLLASCLLFTSTVTAKAETLLIDGQAIEYNLSAISLYVNGKKIETKVMNPIQLDGRVLVPAREVFEAMGAQVAWDNTSKKVTIKYKSKTIILFMNNPVALIDGTEVSMDVPGKIINDKVMIPIRFVSEAMGLAVQWDSANRAVRIDEKTVDIPSTDKEVTGQVYTGTANQNSLTLTSGSYDTASIQTVEVSESSQMMTAKVTASSAISNASFTVMTGKLVLDIKNSKSQLSNQITPNVNTYVKSIRTSQFTADTTRVVFDLKSGAQMKATLSGDRKQIIIEFSKQNIEQIEISSSQGRDTVFIKGFGTAQVQITEDSANKKLYFTLPNTNLEETVNWTNISSSLISKVTMVPSGNDVKGTIELKEKVSFLASDLTNGMSLTLSAGGDTVVEQPDTTKPGQDQEVTEPDKQPEQTQSGISYNAGSKPKFVLSSIKGLTTSQIKVTDDYRNKKLIFDLGADYSTVLKAETRTINDSYIKTLTVSHTGTTKITVETKTIYHYNLSTSSNSITLELVRPSQKFSQIVVIDIGHGGSDSGAVANGLKEKEVNFNQGMALYQLLEADPNIKVYMTREADVYPSLEFRSTLANEIQADLFVSIHNNSASANVQGAETLYYPSATDTRGKQIAQLVQDSLVKDSGMVNRGIKARSDLRVLNSTNMPAILIETGFLTNLSDASRINTSNFINTWAKGVYNAIVEGFKLL